LIWLHNVLYPLGVYIIPVRLSLSNRGAQRLIWGTRTGDRSGGWVRAKNSR